MRKGLSGTHITGLISEVEAAPHHLAISDDHAAAGTSQSAVPRAGA
jgi:hypothetical protein